MIYCVVLNPAIDVIYSTDDLELGSTKTDVDSTILPAGKGINIAKAVRELGEQVCVVSVLPEDDRQRFESFFKKLDIGSLLHPCEGSARINCTIADKKFARVTHLSSEGQQISMRIMDEFIEFAGLHMREKDLWALAGSIPRGCDENIYRRIISLAVKKGARVILDSRGKALKMGIRARPAIIKPNLTELEGYFGEQIQGVRHIALKGKHLLDMGIEYVFITLGADGVIAIHDNECLLCSTPQVEVRDTVGCGDAFTAGLLTGISRKFSFQEMCRLAVACGASNAMHIGAGNILREEVWRLMEDVRIEAV